MINLGDRRHRLWRMMVSICFLLLASAGSCWSAQEQRVITVFAAASLMDALEEVAEMFTEETGVKVRFNFAGSHVLTRHIAAGAPADIFFPADEEKMDRLQSLGLIAGETRRSILSNRLIIVAPEDSDLQLKEIAGLAMPEIRRIALANPQTVPAGIYTRRYLNSIGLWESIHPKVIPTANVRAALGAVKAGNVDVSIVYRSDVFSTAEVKVLWEIPEGEQWRISYPIAILKTAKEKEAAGIFLDFMGKEHVRMIFLRLGFELPVDSIVP